jgi:excisionase family DNA binding protein
VGKSEERALVLTVPDVAAMLQIGRSHAYDLCNSQAFPVLRLGKNLRIPRDGFLAWLERQTRSHHPNE